MGNPISRIMRVALLILVSILFFNVSKGQVSTTYTEINTGFSTGTVPLFPGVSYMYGGSTKYPSGVILDYEGGFAFPSIITGKVGIGFSIDPYLDASIGIRPWPSSTYVQLNILRPNKCTNLVLTVEGMTGRETSFGQNAIFTIGWRKNIFK